jgi:hypothetical protein
MTVQLLTSARFGAIPAVRHGFTTREGGVSSGLRATLDLGSAGPLAERHENWSRVAREFGASVHDVALLRQVHHNEVVEVVAAPGPETLLGPADGAFTTTPGVLLGVRVADCVPVLFAAPGAVGVAHAGWRGVVAGVVPSVVLALCSRLGCTAEKIIAVIGPHAEVDGYEVGPEVVDALEAAGLPRSVVARPGPRGREHADLRAAVQVQLQAVGVKDIDHVWGNTLSEPTFFSHRRDGEGAGRQAGVIGWFG